MNIAILCLACLAIGCLTKIITSHLKHRSKVTDKNEEYILKLYDNKNPRKQVREQSKQMKKLGKEIKNAKPPI